MPLSVEAADPPAPVSGAPDGTVAVESGGVVVGTVGGPEAADVEVMGGTEDVVVVLDVAGAVVVVAEFRRRRWRRCRVRR